MKQDFVPGPWIARGVAVYTDHGGRSRPLKVCDARQPKFTVEAQEGSARLIAAAPDMLAALADATSWLTGDLDIREADMLARVRAAIAKAMGEVA